MLHWYTGRADAEGQVVSGGVPHRSVSKRGQGEARRLCKSHNLTLASHKCSTLCLSGFFSALKTFFPSVYRRVRREPINTDFLHNTFGGGQEFR